MSRFLVYEWVVIASWLSRPPKDQTTFLLLFSALPREQKGELKMKKISRAFNCVLMLLCIATSLAIAQEQKIRTITKAFTFENQPIQVIHRPSGDKPISNDTQILADNKWLKNLTLEIKNVSEKNIIGFNLFLVVEITAKMPSRCRVPIYFRGIEQESGEPKALRPGEVVKVQVSDGDIAYWTKWLKEYDAEDFDRVLLDVRSVNFEDGTRWGMGQYTLPQKEHRPSTPELTNSFFVAAKFLYPVDLSFLVRPVVRKCISSMPVSYRPFFRERKPISAVPAYPGTAFGMTKMTENIVTAKVSTVAPVATGIVSKLTIQTPYQVPQLIS